MATTTYAFDANAEYAREYARGVTTATYTTTGTSAGQTTPYLTVTNVRHQSGAMRGYVTFDVAVQADWAQAATPLSKLKFDGTVPVVNPLSVWAHHVPLT